MKSWGYGSSHTWIGLIDSFGCGSGSLLPADIEANGLPYSAPARGSSVIVMCTLLYMLLQLQASPDVDCHVHTVGG